MEQDDTHRVPRARRISFVRALRRSFSWKSCSCCVLVLLSIFYVSFCHCRHDAYSSHPAFLFSHGPCAQGYNLVPFVVGVIVYAVYLAECWQTRNKLALLKTASVSETEQYLSSLRESSPNVWWKAISYHYARRTRQVTRYRNGEALSASQVYYERVDTVCGEETFLYDSCGVRDISGVPEELKSFPVVRVYVSRGFAFATANSAREFEEQRARFFDDYEQRDDYLEVREGMHLSESVHHLLCIRKACPWFLRPTLFWLFSLFLLSWPIRAIAEWRTAFMHYRVIKLFGTNYLSPSSVNYTGPLTRCSSMDSIALTAAIMSRPLLLPSYSMALLAPQLPRIMSESPPPPPSSLRGYGGMRMVAPPPPLLLPPPPRSTSFQFDPHSEYQRPRRPARSRSFGWSSPWGRIDEESERLLPSENPPPYEVALRLCGPIYERMRSSLQRLQLSSSLHSLPKHLPPSHHNNT